MTIDNHSSISTQNGHGCCLLCGERNPMSMKIAFQADDNGHVSARLQSHSGLQGYDGIIHGGVISALLDAAMTHCLFHQGVRAVTGDLRVRFLQSIPCHAAPLLSAGGGTERRVYGGLGRSQIHATHHGIKIYTK